MADLTDFQVTDDVTDNLAAYHNRLLGGTIRAEFVNTETITATKELTDTDCPFQVITPSGADRTVELAPEATTNHLTFVKNPSGASYNIPVKDDSGSITFCTLAPNQYALCIPAGSAWHVIYSGVAPSFDYKISPSVSSNNLTVSVTHTDGETPSTSRPLFFKINNSIYSATAALSITINAGTNWFNSGGAELATQVAPYFVYVVYDSNSSAVALTIARKPNYRIVASGMTTTTSENHIYGYSGFTDGDNMANIGYFEATLSAGAGYTWTVPTFTNLNLRHNPTFESQIMTWTPTHTRITTPYTNTPTVNRASYVVRGEMLWVYEKHTQNATPGGSGSQRFTLPFTSGYTAAGEAQIMRTVNNSSGVTLSYFQTTNTNYGNILLYDATAECTASHVYITEGEMYIG